MDNKRYKVSTISEYLNIIRDNNMKEYIFRGQNNPYNGIEASGFRLYKGGWDTDKIYDLKKAREEYFSRIGNRLAIDERKYFLAFCQHHGIPTNLIDFTLSPLIALFFACYDKNKTKFTLNELVGDITIDELIKNKSNQDMLIHNLCNKLSKDSNSKYAEVYLINKSRLIDISDILLENNCENFFEELVYSSKLQYNIYEKLVNVFPKDNDNIIKWLTNIIECYNLNECDLCEKKIFNYKSEENDLVKFIKKLNEDIDDSIKELYYYIMNEVYREELTHGDFYYLDEYEVEGGTSYKEIGAKIYLVLMINIIEKFIGCQERLYLNLDIYFIYKCPNIFDRINNQKGLFIYQPYLYISEDVYNYNVLSFQKIIPDVVFEIDEHENILKELDCLGISLDFVYNDLDNIAKYVKNGCENN